MSHLAYGDEGLHDEDGRHRGRPPEGTADPAAWTDQLRRHLVAHWRKRQANLTDPGRWTQSEPGS